MKIFEVEFETTLPPWHIGHEAETPDTAKEKFCEKHEAAHMLKITEVLEEYSGTPIFTNN